MEQFNQYRLFKNGKNLAFEICQKIYKHLGQKSPQIESINFTEFLFFTSRKISWNGFSTWCDFTSFSQLCTYIWRYFFIPSLMVLCEKFTLTKRSKIGLTFLQSCSSSRNLKTRNGKKETLELGSIYLFMLSDVCVLVTKRKLGFRKSRFLSFCTKSLLFRMIFQIRVHRKATKNLNR